MKSFHRCSWLSMKYALAESPPVPSASCTLKARLARHARPPSVGLSVPKTAEGKEKTDIYNPDPKKRNCPIIGLVFISGFIKKSDTRWENGTVYDPKSGKTYSCFMELEGPDKIKVRGFLVVPLMGRNYFWTRAD